MKKRRRGEDEDERTKRPPNVWFFTPNGLRHVKPYVYKFCTHAKGRWYGKNLVEVFASEFSTHNREYYERAILQGRITVNDSIVGADYMIRGGDRIAHTTHRHEPPVRGTETVDIVADTKELLVVNKPSTVPMHPCGAYRYNSLFHILDSVRREEQQQQQQGDSQVETLHIVHRLDRLTSGLTIFAKTPQAAKTFGDDLKSGNTRKTYLARVRGDFGGGPPSCAFQGSVAAGWQRPAAMLECSPHVVGWSVLESGHVTPGTEVDASLRSSGTGGGTGGGGGAGSPTPLVRVRVQHPIACVSPKDGVYRCAYDHLPNPSVMVVGDDAGSSGDDGAKVATTLVRKLSFNGLTSLVEVEPQHGRTHQIRLHLQWLGHPIANDPCYGGELHYGSSHGGIAHEDPLLCKDSNLLQWLQRREEESPKEFSSSSGADSSANKLKLIPSGAPPSSSSSLPGLKEFRGTPPNQSTGGGCNSETTISDATRVGGGGDEHEWYTAPRRESESEEDFMVRTCRFCHGALATTRKRQQQRRSSEDAMSAAHTHQSSSSSSLSSSSLVVAEGQAFGEEQLHCSGIWLHALRYERQCASSPSNNWKFETPMPKWAFEGFVETL